MSKLKPGTHCGSEQIKWCGCLPSDMCACDEVEEIYKLRAELEAAKKENICDACAGTGKPISSKPCMCGGTGKASDAVSYLRSVIIRLESDLEAAREAIQHYESMLLPEERTTSKLQADLVIWKRTAELINQEACICHYQDDGGNCIQEKSRKFDDEKCKRHALDWYRAQAEAEVNDKTGMVYDNNYIGHNAEPSQKTGDRCVALHEAKVEKG